MDKPRRMRDEKSETQFTCHKCLKSLGTELNLIRHLKELHCEETNIQNTESPIHPDIESVAQQSRNFDSYLLVFESFPDLEVSLNEADEECVSASRHIEREEDPILIEQTDTNLDGREINFEIEGSLFEPDPPSATLAIEPKNELEQPYTEEHVDEGDRFISDIVVTENFEIQGYRTIVPLSDGSELPPDNEEFLTAFKEIMAKQTDTNLDGREIHFEIEGSLTVNSEVGGNNLSDNLPENREVPTDAAANESSFEVTSTYHINRELLSACEPGLLMDQVDATVKNLVDLTVNHVEGTSTEQNNVMDNFQGYQDNHAIIVMNGNMTNEAPLDSSVGSNFNNNIALEKLYTLSLPEDLANWNIIDNFEIRENIEHDPNSERVILHPSQEVAVQFENQTVYHLDVEEVAVMENELPVTSTEIVDQALYDENNFERNDNSLASNSYLNPETFSQPPEQFSDLSHATPPIHVEYKQNEKEFSKPPKTPDLKDVKLKPPTKTSFRLCKPIKRLVIEKVEVATKQPPLLGNKNGSENDSELDQAKVNAAASKKERYSLTSVKEIFGNISRGMGKSNAIPISQPQTVVKEPERIISPLKKSLVQQLKPLDEFVEPLEAHVEFVVPAEALCESMESLEALEKSVEPALVPVKQKDVVELRNIVESREVYETPGSLEVDLLNSGRRNLRDGMGYSNLKAKRIGAVKSSGTMKTSRNTQESRVESPDVGATSLGAKLDQAKVNAAPSKKARYSLTSVKEIFGNISRGMGKSNAIPISQPQTVVKEPERIISPLKKSLVQQLKPLDEFVEPLEAHVEFVVSAEALCESMESLEALEKSVKPALVPVKQKEVVELRNILESSEVYETPGSLEVDLINSGRRNLRDGMGDSNLKAKIIGAVKSSGTMKTSRKTPESRVESPGAKPFSKNSRYIARRLLAQNILEAPNLDVEQPSFCLEPTKLCFDPPRPRLGVESPNVATTTIVKSRSKPTTRGPKPLLRKKMIQVNTSTEPGTKPVIRKTKNYTKIGEYRGILRKREKNVDSNDARKTVSPPSKKKRVSLPLDESESTVLNKTTKRRYSQPLKTSRLAKMKRLTASDTEANDVNQAKIALSYFPQSQNPVTDTESPKRDNLSQLTNEIDTKTSSVKLGFVKKPISVLTKHRYPTRGNGINVAKANSNPNDDQSSGIKKFAASSLLSVNELPANETKSSGASGQTSEDKSSSTASLEKSYLSRAVKAKKRKISVVKKMGNKANSSPKQSPLVPSSPLISSFKGNSPCTNKSDIDLKSVYLMVIDSVAKISIRVPVQIYLKSLRELNVNLRRAILPVKKM